MSLLCSRTVTFTSTCAGQTTPMCLGLSTPKTLLRVLLWVLVSKPIFIYVFFYELPPLVFTLFNLFLEFSRGVGCVFVDLEKVYDRVLRGSWDLQRSM